MEDKRAEPRNRPPELQTNGLWNCPTLLNNVETFAWVPAIVLRDDGQWFARQGSNPDKSHIGRRFFSISGDVAKPGAYEVPIGIKFGELINEYAGGMAGGQEFKAAALSGPSGGFLPRSVPVEFLSGRWVSKNLPAGATHFDILDLELDIQETRDMGIMMGAGIVIFGDQSDVVATALSATRFYRNESCGKCVPCRIGSQKLVELVSDIADRKYTLQEIFGVASAGLAGKQGLVLELAETMKLTAICGLGTVASNPLTTLLNFFRADVERYAKIQSEVR
jgi:NADH:ubiquinone oxidoreductase subunit F (NADH-binding)